MEKMTLKGLDAIIFLIKESVWIDENMMLIITLMIFISGVIGFLIGRRFK